MLPCLSLLCFMVFGPPGLVLGDGFSAISAAPRTSVQAFGQQNPQCKAWSDSCVTCTATAAGPATCSTAGIACTPTPIACQRP
ncbi:hypothetical protein LGH83_16505 [Lichenihabitans sp. PAMC28606]|uniref:hypothetical protein n=1 Tax=Lichenihabitans sp. PAMC28606 TaxID=2880932 RepID=UPI001D0B6A57|nr:hypothetical protein [Lichenihabitans sp. PAMC28606]UDL94114.1 hypothetical protein LGH83_16505 [Lichenihabitans sp. PAMC28606]